MERKDYNGWRLEVSEDCKGLAFLPFCEDTVPTLRALLSRDRRPVLTLSIPLRLAQFCSNCEDVFIQVGGSRCPVCESRAVRPLSAFLNREQSFSNREQFENLVNVIMQPRGEV